jgi:hypothetical protein
MKVRDAYRTNASSLVNGGVTVCVVKNDGKIYEYDKVKNADLYIKKVLEAKNVIKAYIKK